MRGCVKMGTSFFMFLLSAVKRRVSCMIADFYFSAVIAARIAEKSSFCSVYGSLVSQERVSMPPFSSPGSFS